MMINNAYLNFLEESFPGIKVNIERWEALGFSWDSRPFLKEEKGEFLSHVGLLEYPMLIEGRKCKVAGLHAICTKATQRGQGFASELIKEALEWAKKQYDFVVLFTEIPKFYEKLSFRTIQEYRFHLPCHCSKGSRSLIPLTSPQDHPLFLRFFKPDLPPVNGSDSNSFPLDARKNEGVILENIAPSFSKLVRASREKITSNMTAFIGGKSGFNERAPISNHFWMKDNGTISAFNALFATYPTYWSLYYSSSINGLLSYLIKDKTLHLYDIIASKIPSLELILDHLPTEIEEIYFYFSPDLLTNEATAEPYLYDNGYFMVHGDWPAVKPFMISPLSRC